MNLKKLSIAKLQKQVIQILDKYQVLIFGSRLTDKDSDYSDIDIGIEETGKIPAKKILDIKEDLENLPTLYTIDLVDFNNVDPDFYNLTKKNIKLLN